MKIMPAITKLMWVAIILLIVSGIALTPLVTWPMDATILVVKHVLVVILVLNAIILTIKKEKYAKIGGPAGLVLWYLILVLSVVM